jgi:electron transfer flavoprotein beta subunit
MRLLVLMEVGADTRIPPQLDSRSGRVRDEWLVRETDPGSSHALDLALRLKAARPNAEVIVVHLGPPDTEPWLRRSLARGCDRAVRIWDDESAGVHAAGKAVILAAAAQAAGFDLVLSGAAGVVNGDGQLGVLLAAHLGVPCVTQIVDLAPLDTMPHTRNSGDEERAEDSADIERVAISRGLDGGYCERLEAVLPLVATIAGGVAAKIFTAADVTAAALLAAQATEITVWDLADLGVPLEQVRRAGRALRYGRPRPVRPRLHPAAAPDPSLPAFERILKLVQGSVRRREGRIIRQPAESIADEVFRTLRDEGWLDHLRSGGPSAPTDPVGEVAAGAVNSAHGAGDVPARGSGGAGDRP